MPVKPKTHKPRLKKQAAKKRPGSLLAPKIRFKSWMAAPIACSLIVLAFAWVSFSKASTRPAPICNGVNMCAPVPAGVPELIEYWSEYYHLDGGRMLRIAQCESRLDPKAVNHNGHYGVYQFLPSTYAANYVAAGAGPDYWDAGNNIRTAAYMFSINQAWQWQCKG